MTNLYRWNIIHSISMLSGLIFLIFTRSVVVIVSLATLTFILLGIFQKNELKHFKPWGGYANYITGLRFLLISLLGFACFTFTTLFAVALLTLILDAVDGFVARKLDQTSKTGSLFDLEVDSCYVLILSSLLWLYNLLPWWIVAVGSLRYIFVMMVRIFNLDYRKDKRTPLGPIVAALHFTVLLLPFVLPMKLILPLCITTALLVTLSFLYSFYKIIH